MLGVFFITGKMWIAEVAIATAMVATVIVVAMEAHKEPPLIQLFSGLGFLLGGDPVHADDGRLRHALTAATASAAAALQDRAGQARARC